MSKGRVKVQLDSVEIKLGNDGFFRGKPEPELLFVIYAVCGQTARMLEAARRSLNVEGSFPCEVKIADRDLFVRQLPRGCQRVILLCLALENDKGIDVARLYHGLPEVGAWQVRAGRSRFSAPFSIDELSLLEPLQAPAAQQVRLTFDKQDLEETCTVDDWVGASLITLPTGRRHRERWRMRIVSPDGKNDWVARLQVDLSPSR